jgi:hypothetical protein
MSLTEKNEEGIEIFLSSIAERFAKEIGLLPEIDKAYTIVCDEYYKYREAIDDD